MNIELKLVALMKATIIYLTEQVDSGEPSSQDISNIIKLLKDNSITCDTEEPSAKSSLLKDSAAGLPQQELEEITQYA